MTASRAKSGRYRPTRFWAPGSVYDQGRADRAVAFFRSLKHTKGEWAGKPFDLLPWQEQIIRDVFGIVDADGNRQFRTAYVSCGKKQGKSAIAAAVALYLLALDGEEGAEVYGCAVDRGQAAIVFDVAAQMVRNSPALARRCKILDSYKRILFHPLRSFYQVLSAEVPAKHGLNVHGLIFDELHAQTDRRLYDVMTKGASDARRQPLNFIITTAGDNLQSIGYEVHSKARDIVDGRKVDPTFYPAIFEAAEGDKWTSPATWKKANPSLGVTVTLDKLRVACVSAQENPVEENLFRQLRLNQWVKQSVRWMPMDKWDDCADVVTGLEGRVCFGGLDLASTTDITAFVLVFPPEGDEPLAVMPFFWMPEENISLRVRRDKVQYDKWQKQGYLLTTDGNVVHYEAIEKFIESLGQAYDIREIAFDRWGATQMAQNLEGAGFKMVAFSQGFQAMSAPTNELMRLVMCRKLVHGGHPVLRWMADNVYVKTGPEGKIRPDKEKSGEKIDGIVALIMALDRAGRHGATKSVYDDPEALLWL